MTAKNRKMEKTNTSVVVLCFCTKIKMDDLVNARILPLGNAFDEDKPGVL